MKTTSILGAVLASAAAASAQVKYENGKYTCEKANVAYCAGDSLGTDIIIRCNADKVGQPGRCSDNLAGQPPLGVKPALCWQSSPTAGDAACAKNCVVYAGDKIFTLPIEVCKPTYTATSTLPSSTASVPPTSSSSASSSSSSSSSGGGGVVTHTSAVTVTTTDCPPTTISVSNPTNSATTTKLPSTTTTSSATNTPKPPHSSSTTSYGCGGLNWHGNCTMTSTTTKTTTTLNPTSSGSASASGSVTRSPPTTTLLTLTTALTNPPVTSNTPPPTKTSSGVRPSGTVETGAAGRVRGGDAVLGLVVVGVVMGGCSKLK